MDKRLQTLGLTEADLERLREQHGRIWVGSIRPGGGAGEILFIWRAPRQQEIDLMLGAVRKGAQAQRNVLSAVLVHPDRQTVLEQLRPWPLAVGTFVGEHVLPLAGSDAETTADEL